MNDQSTNKIKCDFILFYIFNGLSAIENGNTSVCCENSELIRISLKLFVKQIAPPAHERLTLSITE